MSLTHTWRAVAREWWDDLQFALPLTPEGVAQAYCRAGYTAGAPVQVASIPTSLGIGHEVYGMCSWQEDRWVALVRGKIDRHYRLRVCLHELNHIACGDILPGSDVVLYRHARIGTLEEQRADGIAVALLDIEREQMLTHLRRMTDEITPFPDVVQRSRYGAFLDQVRR